MLSGKTMDKFRELIIYIVHNYNNSETLTETKLWKLLYFCDADFYEKHKRTITGIEYFKNTYGATPDIKVVDKVLPELKDSVKVETIKKADGKKIKLYKPDDNYQPSYKLLTADEIEEIRKTCEKYYRLSASDVSVLAHKDPPYLGTDMRKPIDFKFVNYREDEIDDIDENESSYKGTISDEAAGKLLTYVRRGV